MLDRIARFSARHQMLEPGQRVGVAVSGGADSVFLLHALRELAPRWNLQLSVIHIDHGIRGEASVGDARFVEELAANLAVPFHLRLADVPSLGGNLEQAARRVRHDFYRELIAAGRVHRVATGHTRSDQAETVLYRILRGSGLTGLAGILPITKEGLIRPLLELDRSEIECWLRKRGVRWREDETNRDFTYARNRLRHEILPLLRESFNPQLDDALSNLATLARDEENYWRSQLPHPQPAILSIADLTASPALARRIVRAAIETAKGDLHTLDFDHVERVLDLARSPSGHGRIQLPGLDVWRSFDWIRIAPHASVTSTSISGYSTTIEVPGCVELPASNARISLRVLEKEERTQPCATVVSELDWQRLCNGSDAPSLELRNWRPGDQYRRIGHSIPQKIKFFFQKHRIPVWERSNWPIITCSDTVVWARRFGAAAEFAAGPQTAAVLQVSESEQEL